MTFSRRNIFAMKRSIEEATGKRCAVIYGVWRYPVQTSEVSPYYLDALLTYADR